MLFLKASITAEQNIKNCKAAVTLNTTLKVKNNNTEVISQVIGGGKKNPLQKYHPLLIYRLQSANPCHVVRMWSSSSILTPNQQNARAYGDAFPAKQTAASSIILGLLMTIATPRDRCCCLLTSPWPWNNARCTEFKDDHSNYVRKMRQACVELTGFDELDWQLLVWDMLTGNTSKTCFTLKNLKTAGDLKSNQTH